MKEFTRLKDIGRRALTVGRYLHGDSPGEQQARKYDTQASRSKGARGAGTFDMEPRDPLEMLQMGPERDLYVESSFWQDVGAELFEDSRFDLRWDVEESYR